MTIAASILHRPRQIDAGIESGIFNHGLWSASALKYRLRAPMVGNETRFSIAEIDTNKNEDSSSSSSRLQPNRRGAWFFFFYRDRELIVIGTEFVSVGTALAVRLKQGDHIVDDPLRFSNTTYPK